MSTGGRHRTESPTPSPWTLRPPVAILSAISDLCVRRIQHCKAHPAVSLGLPEFHGTVCSSDDEPFLAPSGLGVRRSVQVASVSDILKQSLTAPRCDPTCGHIPYDGHTGSPAPESRLHSIGHAVPACKSTTHPDQIVFPTSGR